MYKHSVTRAGVFETNSSSSHSLTIAANPKFNAAILPVINGVCNIYPGEFGRGTFTDHNDAPTKASYILTFLKLDTIYDPDRAAKEQLLIDVIKHETGAKEVHFVQNPDEYYYPWGYIDHESGGLAYDAFGDGATSLRAFIFNPDSVLTIGGS